MLICYIHFVCVHFYLRILFKLWTILLHESMNFTGMDFLTETMVCNIIPLIISNSISRFGFTVPALSLFRPFLKLQFMFPIKLRNLIRIFFGNVDKNQMALTFFVI